MRSRRPRFTRAVLFLALSFAACGGSEGSDLASLGIAIDSLPGGAVHVSNPDGGVWGSDPDARWALEEDLRMGVLDGDEAYMFGSSLSVLPATEGGIWVLDSQAHALRRFNADGSLDISVGREGEGPGEFASYSCAHAGPDGEVWVETRRSWQRFDARGQLIGSMPVQSNLGCGIRRWMDDGRYFVVNVDYSQGVSERTSTYHIYRMTEEGELTQIDSVQTPRVSRPNAVEWKSNTRNFTIRSTIPFTPRALVSLGPQGNFWLSDPTDDYRFRQQNLAGDPTRILSRGYTPVAVTSEARAAALESFIREDMTPEGGFDPDDVPGSYPPFERLMFADDGHIWVEREIGLDRRALDVFRPDGVYLGEVVIPEAAHEMRMSAITADAIYGTVRDDLDVSYVVRMRIVKPKG